MFLSTRGSCFFVFGQRLCSHPSGPSGGTLLVLALNLATAAVPPNAARRPGEPAGFNELRACFQCANWIYYWLCFQFCDCCCHSLQIEPSGTLGTLISPVRDYWLPCTYLLHPLCLTYIGGVWLPMTNVPLPSQWTRTNVFTADPINTYGGWLGVRRRRLTCAFLDAGSFLHGVPTQFALEIILPELCKPNISPVVLQRSADEVAIKPWKTFQTNKSARMMESFAYLSWRFCVKMLFAFFFSHSKPVGGSIFNQTQYINQEIFTFPAKSSVNSSRFTPIIYMGKALNTFDGLAFG